MPSTAYPIVMTNAAEDLTATIEGRFSPDDWEKILKRARATLDDGRTWPDVIRDFHQTRYWGFVPNYRRPKIKKPKNLGMQFIWMTFASLTIMKVAVLWFGQIYSRSDDPSDKWIFFAVLSLIVGNIVFFLWRSRHHVD